MNRMITLPPVHAHRVKKRTTPIKINCCMGVKVEGSFTDSMKCFLYPQGFVRVSDILSGISRGFWKLVIVYSTVQLARYLLGATGTELSESVRLELVTDAQFMLSEHWGQVRSANLTLEL